MTKLEEYYTKFKEDHRLTTRHGQVEFEVSMQFIHKYIDEVKLNRRQSPDSAEQPVKILDVGAGTGRYSIALAKEGHDVTAVELVKHNLDILQSKHENVKTWQGNAIDLHFLEDNTFDITLLFGPLYHLQSEEEKLKALTEAKRVTKNGGVILVAYVMNEYSIITYCFKQKNILECLKNKTVTKDFKALTTSDDLYCYTRLEEMTELNIKAGLERITTFAPDGAADYMRRELNALSAEEFAAFIEYQKAVCERSDLLGASSHTVDVLRVKHSV